MGRTDTVLVFSGSAECDWYFERLSWIIYQMQMAKPVFHSLYHIVLYPLLHVGGGYVIGPHCSIAVTVEAFFSFRGKEPALLCIGFSVDSKLNC